MIACLTTMRPGRKLTANCFKPFPSDRISFFVPMNIFAFMRSTKLVKAISTEKIQDS